LWAISVIFRTTDMNFPWRRTISTWETRSIFGTVRICRPINIWRVTCCMVSGVLTDWKDIFGKAAEGYMAGSAIRWRKANAGLIRLMTDVGFGQGKTAHTIYP